MWTGAFNPFSHRLISLQDATFTPTSWASWEVFHGPYWSLKFARCILNATVSSLVTKFFKVSSMWWVVPFLVSLWNERWIGFTKSHLTLRSTVVTRSPYLIVTGSSRCLISFKQSVLYVQTTMHLHLYIWPFYFLNEDIHA